MGKKKKIKKEKDDKLDDKEDKKEEKKEDKDKVSLKKCFRDTLIILVLLVVGYLIASEIKGNDFSDMDTTYVIRG